MIVPEAPSTAANVAAHYDELDLAYRRVWGDHVHHGYWRTGREAAAEATAELVRLVELWLGLEPGQRVCDIGCGYGATAAVLLARHDVTITGLTLSQAQSDIAGARGLPGLHILCRDWLDNGLAEASFDRAYAIESSEHMTDKPLFFAEARRVLQPGGRLVVCAWLEGPGASLWQKRHLLIPICREGRLPNMGSRADYQRMAADAGFRQTGYRDISRQVRRTWSICLARLVPFLLADSAGRRLLGRRTKSRDFLLSLPRLIVAFRTGAIRYGVFQWEAI